LPFHDPMPKKPKKRSHTEAFAIYGKCFRIRRKLSSTTYRCPLHKKRFYLADVVVGEAVRVIQCTILDDRCYNESNMVVIEKLTLFGEKLHFHLPVDCIDVNKPLLVQYPLSVWPHHVMVKPNETVDSFRQKLADKEEENECLQYLNTRLVGADRTSTSRNDAVRKLHVVQRNLRYTRDGLSSVNTNLEAEKTKRLKDYSSLEETKNKEIASLNDKVKKKEKLIVEQQDQLLLEQKRSHRYTNLEAEKSALMAEKTKHLKEYSNLKETKNKDNLLVEQQDQLILEKKYKAVSKLTVENRHLKKELEAERNKVKPVNSETDLKTQLEKANFPASLHLVKRTQRCSLSSLSTANTNLEAEKSALMAEKAKLLKDYSSLEDTKSKEIASLNDKIHVEQQDQLKAVSKLEAENSTHVAEKTKLLKDYSSLEDIKSKDIASLNDKVKQQDQLILENDKAVSKLKFEKSTLVAEKTKLLKDYSSLEDTKSKDIASLNDTVKQQDQLILEMIKAVSKLTDENRHFKKVLEAERNKVKVNSETDFKTQLELAQKDCEVKEAEIVKLKAEFLKVKANLDTIQIKVLEMKRESELVQVDKHDKEKVLDDLRKSCKALETELQKVKKNVRLVNDQTSMFLKAKAVEIEISKVEQCPIF
jgi:hypothetical protein